MRAKPFILTAILVFVSTVAGRGATWRPHLVPSNLRDTITVQIVRHCSPAIASITAKRLVMRRINPFGNMFWGPIGIGPVVEVPADFLGSGFIIQKDGYMVTNNHVVDQARSISVTLSDGRKFSAHLVGNDPEADLAILKIDAKQTFPTIPLGDSKDLMIGEPAIAVGNPFGYSQSVSSGIVSAIHREIHEPNNPIPLKNLIQTDAAINPGNSGGPLLNAYGQVIGINTAIRGNAQNIGFAIGVNRLCELIPELMNPAHVNNVNIPLRLTAIRTMTGSAHVQEKVVVAGTKTPAVIAIDGQPTPTLVDAYAALLKITPAVKTVSVRFADGVTRQYPVSRIPPSPVVLKAEKIMGAMLQQLTPALAWKYQLGVQSGLLVREIAPHSVAANAGLRPGDVLVQLGPYPLHTLHNLGVLLPLLPHAGQVRAGVVRNDRLYRKYLRFP